MHLKKTEIKGKYGASSGVEAAEWIALGVAHGAIKLCGDARPSLASDVARDARSDSSPSGTVCRLGSTDELKDTLSFQTVSGSFPGPKQTNQKSKLK